MRGVTFARIKPYVPRKKFKTLRARKAQAGLSSLGAPKCKTTVNIDNVAESFPTRTFTFKDLCIIPKSDTNVQNARNGQSAQIMGFRHKEWFANLSNLAMHIWCIWAIPKQYNPGDTALVVTDDFYTRHGLADDQDGSWQETLPSYLFDEPINPDKWTVIKRKKIVLGPGVAAAAGSLLPNKDCQKTINTWIPLNRKFTYGSAGDSEQTTLPLQPPVYYISFCCPPFQPTGTPTPNLVLRERHVITYFRDGESGMK